MKGIVFDGEELLGYSIKQIRELVDFVVVVYQTTSNYGHKNPNLLDTLNQLKAEGLIDMLFEFEPTFEYDSDNKIKILNGTPNEIEKRNILTDIELIKEKYSPYKFSS